MHDLSTDRALAAQFDEITQIIRLKNRLHFVIH